MLIFTFELVLWLVLVVAKVPLHFDDARDFYHNLGEKAISFLLFKTPLNEQMVTILGRLVADEKFNIQSVYEDACRLNMTKGRAIELLNLVKDRKDLEMYLLGPACLTCDIIKARKDAPNMWPPIGFPLLVDGFRPDEIPTGDIKDILNLSLAHPEWWQSRYWIDRVKWSEFDDLGFWRMVPDSVSHLNGDIYNYLMKSIVQISSEPTLQDLEGLLMMSIRMPYFKNAWKSTLKERNLDETTLLSKFSHLNDPWSSKVLDILKIMYSEKWEKRHLPGLLAGSGLYQLAFWQRGSIDLTTTINDIFELFIVSLPLAITKRGKGALGRLIATFLADIPDWSGVRPIVLHRAILHMTAYRKYSALLVGHVDRMLRSGNLCAVLPSWLLVHSTSLQAYKYAFKGGMSLRSEFESGRQEVGTLDRYTRLLYEQSMRNCSHWPGMMVVHKLSGERIRRELFKPSHKGDGTYDPRTDQDYDDSAWCLAFQSIKFDVEHGIPSDAIPSICFLRALLYHHKTRWNNWSWTEFKRAFGEECPIPEGGDEEDRFEMALKWAKASFFDSFPSFPVANAELLQEFIRGEVAKETSNWLISNSMDLSL